MGTQPELIKSYSLLGCTIDFGGPLKGFGEGDAITIAPTSDSFTLTEGVDGTAVLSATGSEAFTIKVKLLHTSLANALMSALWVASKQAGGLFVPFLYRDNASVDVFTSPRAMITRPPDLVRSNKPSTQEWSITAGNGVLFLGGQP